MMQIKIDPEFQSLIDPLSSDEYKGLEQNIIDNGLNDPIVTWNDTIVDGHNRYAICTKNGIEIKTRAVSFPSREHAIRWIIRNQLDRRNLLTQARIKLAMRFAHSIEEEARAKMESGINQYSPSQNSDKGSKIRTDKKIGEIAGTSHNTVHQYRKVQKDGSDEIKEKLDKGEITINAAYQTVKPKPAQLKSEPTAPKGDDTSLEAIKAFAAELKKPLPSTGSGNKIHNVDPIITDLTDKLKSFVNEVAEYQYISNKVSPELRTLIDQTIARLNNIKSKIKEK